jgi:hypothetical protein
MSDNWFHDPKDTGWRFVKEFGLIAIIIFIVVQVLLLLFGLIRGIL